MVAPLAAIPRPGDHGRVRDAPAALELEIERLTFGPDALAHDGGQVVFVAHAAPGDRVRARVVERRRGYVRAETVAVDRAGPARVVPPCPAFGRCGGCQWQHVDVAAQRDAKAAIVAEQLARLGGLRDAPVRPTIAGGPAWAYRSRITLVAEGRRLGFHAAASHRLEPIETCAIAATPLEAHLPIARTWVARLRATVLRVTLVVAPGGVVLAATTRGRPGPADVTDTETLLAAHATVRGAILSGAGARVVVGDATVRQEIESGLALEVPADVFTQVNSEANQALVRTVVDAGGFEAGARVLDLYCGAGNLSLPLARRGADVTGIERSPVAIHAAQANAARLG
ncbi:MAG TPA: methyltransferase domain-containing protein, partial [Candidatus Eisenbacteria bacterium]|nr:methyltransferase domain-containing protein [Candidatus Eisenbacteria bacterium]